MRRTLAIIAAIIFGASPVLAGTMTSRDLQHVPLDLPFESALPESVMKAWSELVASGGGSCPKLADTESTGLMSLTVFVPHGPQVLAVVSSALLEVVTSLCVGLLGLGNSCLPTSPVLDGLLKPV